MFTRNKFHVLFSFSLVLFSCIVMAVPADKSVNLKSKHITISNPKITMLLDYDKKASITTLIVNGQKVVNSADGIFTSVKANGITYSSLRLKETPVLERSGNTMKLKNIIYGDKSVTISENWIFTISDNSIKWTLERNFSNAVNIQEAALPAFNFDNINTWEGAYQDYGGLAWFYLFNEKLATYGVHTNSSRFWNSVTGNGLTVAVDAPGRELAMKYSRTNEDKLAFSVTVSDKEILPQFDSGTNRRRFIRKRTDVWAPFNAPAGKSSECITLSYFDFNESFGRGRFVGINGRQVSAVLNTIARIGVIDKQHFGGNSWHTPYGPICLHEQYIAQLGLAINDETYLKGYQECLDFYRDNAMKPDGRVWPRWAYNNIDIMKGQVTDKGFYEAQWGFLLDSNPDFVTNVAELYDQTGNTEWVKSHQLSCEKALDWLLKRDSNRNGLVEMMNDNSGQKQSSDWIDIIWASYENAFVNAKLYHALVKWAVIEHQLNNGPKAKYYEEFAAKLKASFNKSTKDGGFWDEGKGCYVHWIDKDGSVHGNNMVTPVNFMAIAYGICDNSARKKTILDGIEAQMQKEKLFFWPLAMTSYAPGEGKEWQYPFPAYENGDLFLSWGSIGVAAYAGYAPGLAVKYVKNVLKQYGKDGLAFQRYGRINQNGLGDDILSGNSLAIVGLYEAIYGINPLYNRLYLDPHITPELAGTSLKYNFRGDHLMISLDNNSYSISDKIFKVTAPSKFGFYAEKNELSYFRGDDSQPSLQVKTNEAISLKIHKWNSAEMEWGQTIRSAAHKPVIYLIHQLKPATTYLLSADGKPVSRSKSDLKGDIHIKFTPKAVTQTLAIRNGN